MWTVIFIIMLNSHHVKEADILAQYAREILERRKSSLKPLRKSPYVLSPLVKEDKSAHGDALNKKHGTNKPTQVSLITITQ